MHTNQLTQIQLRGAHDFEPVTRYNLDTTTYARDEAKQQDTVLGWCTANLWPKGSYATGCPRPILVAEHHQQKMQDIHEALTIAIVDIVQRWWADTDARFPERMPLEKEEEDILKVYLTRIL